MQTLASGFGLVESPRWHDGALYFSDWTAGEIRRLNADGSTSVVVRHASLPLCFDFTPAGDMLVVSAATRTLLRLRGGSLDEFADLRPLSQMGANDIVVDGRGNAYVNSPNAPFGSSTPPGRPAPGRVALITTAGQLSVVAEDLDFPNGMAITADNRTLVVAESYRQQLTAFDIGSDGSLSGRRVFAELNGDPPDGITIDASGAVWYADVPHQHCVRVAEGGGILDRADADRGAFACILGEADLYVVGARWPGAAGMTPEWNWDGTVWSTPAPAPGAGWPGN